MSEPNQKVIGKCKLCQETRELQYSHIIPELFFRYIYDDKSRALIIKSSELKKTTIQKGHREHMLCKKCEKHIGKNETYVARVWHKDFPKISKSNITAIKLDYKRFRLLHLSILWRASVSTLDFFSKVSLGKHEEIIRKMILTEDAGKPDQYSFMAKIIHHDNKKIFHLITPPQIAKQTGFTFYEFAFGGVVWEYIVSSLSSKKFNNNYPFFSEDNKLYLPSQNVIDSKIIVALDKKVLEQNSLERLRKGLGKK